MKIPFRFYLSLSIGLLAAQATVAQPSQSLAPSQATQTAPAPAQTPAAEPPVKAVPLTERKSKPQRVDDDAPDSPDQPRAGRGVRSPHHPGRGPHRPGHGLGGGRGRAGR